MLTIGQLEQQLNVTVFDYLARDTEVPTVTRIAAQGDVLISRVDRAPAATPLPQGGYPVVRSEASSNTHSLHGDGFFDPAPTGDGELALGTLTVPEGGEAFLAHPEHAFLAIAPGTYQIGRQREWAGTWRMVAD